MHCLSKIQDYFGKVDFGHLFLSKNENTFTKKNMLKIEEKAETIKNFKV